MSAYKDLEKIFERISHLNHLHAIVNWDEAVMMPIGGGVARAKALATLDALIHETLTQKKIAELIKRAKEEPLNNSWEQANLKWIEKKYRKATSLPSELIRKITEASVRSEQAWRQYRKENNWQDFMPFLKKLLNLIKKSATIRSQCLQKSPYDVLIDDYSANINQALIDPIFKQLATTLPNLTQQVMEKQRLETVIQPEGPFPIDKQHALGLEIMHTMGFDFNRGRLDVSHHPFCGGVPQDIRITTRYNIDEFMTSVMAICHETGHAYYEQQLPTKWIDQPVGHVNNMSLHESQSLLLEMQACRTQAFMHYLSPLVKKYFGNYTAYTPDNLFRLCTRVKPGYIRVDADEVTYSLHIILRYEIEKELIEGEMNISDLPDAWDAGMTKYLGLSTKDNYKNGVMQDVHWPSGFFGYFPAYSLGSLIAAQLFAAAKKTHPKLLQQISKGVFSTLLNWLNKNIHSRASSVNTQQLLSDATGETLNPSFFMTHLRDRYLR